MICRGVDEKVVRLGECGGKEVERSRGYTSALRDPYSSVKEEGDGKVVSAAG